MIADTAFFSTDSLGRVALGSLLQARSLPSMDARVFGYQGAGQATRQK